MSVSAIKGTNVFSSKYNDVQIQSTCENPNFLEAASLVPESGEGLYCSAFPGLFSHIPRTHMVTFPNTKGWICISKQWSLIKI